jgi:hypothetical protein
MVWLEAYKEITADLLSLACAPGAKRQKATELMPDIRAQWKGMSKEEQIVATEESIRSIKETREMKAFAPQNVMINAFHDTEKTLKSIDEAVSRLHSL